MTENVADAAEVSAPNALTDAPTVEEPVTTPTEADTAGNDPQAGSDPQTASEPEQPKEDTTPKWLKDRLDKITAQKYEATRRAEAAEARLKELEAQKPQAAPPNLDEYDDTAKYNEALAEYVRNVAAQAANEKAQEITSQQATQAQQASLQAFQQREAQFAVENADYFQVTRAESLPINEVMVNELRDSDKAPEILYHLGKNPQLAFAISQQAPAEAAQSLASLELQLSKPKKPSTTKAPPPPSPATGGSEPVTKDPSKMSTKEYQKWRLSGGGRSN